MKLLREYMEPELEIIVEQSSCKVPRSVKIKGPYIMTEVKNNNGRTYKQSLMESCVDVFRKNMILTNRAVGELNHPAGVTIDYNNVCHRIISLTQDKNTWIGESIILTGTPKGDLIAALLYHNTKIGMSTRGVGEINEHNIIDREYKIITVDLVSDPSIACFVDSLNESKNYMIDKYGDIVEMAVNTFEKKLASVSMNDAERGKLMVEALRTFINSI